MKQGSAPHTFVGWILSTFPPPRYLRMNSVGIDISEQDIRFLEFVDEDGEYSVGAYGAEQIPENVIARGEVVDVEKLTGILSQIKEKYNFSFVRASLPEQRGYIFQTTVPDARDRGEVYTILEFQLEEHVPISPDEAVFDYTVIAEHKEVGHTDISVTVFPRQVIEKYLAAFSRAGLVPLSFEVEPQAITRAVIPSDERSTYLLLNIAPTRIGIFVVTNHAVSFTSSIDIAGAALGDSVEKPETFSQHVRRLASEVERYEMYWNSRTNAEDEKMPDIEQVVLCGAYAATPKLAETLNAQLATPVVRANVWQNAFSFDDTIPPVHRDDSYGFATAIGLALRESNV